MKVDTYGRIIVTEEEAFNSLYQGIISNFDQLFFDNNHVVEQFNSSVKINFDDVPLITKLTDISKSIDDFDQENQKNWFIPETYKNFEIETWLYKQCTTDEEMVRVKEELFLFSQHGMTKLLNYLKYLVDTMREHKIVWGVGRGSSVSSYVLYLIGVHKINSLKYNLDIKEFLK